MTPRGGNTTDCLTVAVTLYVASSFLFCLQRLAVFVNRVNLVVKNVVHQLASLYSAKPVSQCIDPTDVHLDTVFTHLGRALTILVTLDTVIDGNEVLAEHWTLYKRLAPFRAHSFFLFLLPQWPCRAHSVQRCRLR